MAFYQKSINRLNPMEKIVVNNIAHRDDAHHSQKKFVFFIV